MKNKPKPYVQLVQVSDSHPWTDGAMYVGKDGKLKPLKENVGETTKIKCRCK